jgi:DNA polymerase III delta prime subunit
VASFQLPSCRWHSTQAPFCQACLNQQLMQHFIHVWAREHASALLLCRLQLGEAGMQALISLGNGDMRRTLNIFQVLRTSSASLLQLLLMCSN